MKVSNTSKKIVVIVSIDNQEYETDDILLLTGLVRSGKPVPYATRFWAYIIGH